MQLVSIRENELRVDLDWADVKLLAHIIRHAISHDVGSTVHDPDMITSYADTALAFLEAGGMASWAHTVEYQTFTLERFAQVVALTPEEWRAEQERFAVARREMQRERRPREAPPAA